MSVKILFSTLPLFPANKQLEKRWWHRFAKAIGFFFYYVALLSVVGVALYYFLIIGTYIFGNKSEVLKLRRIVTSNTPYPSGSVKLIEKEKFFKFINEKSENTYSDIDAFKESLSQDLELYAQKYESDEYMPNTAVPVTVALHNDAYNNLIPVGIFHQKYWKSQVEEGFIFGGLFFLFSVVPYLGAVGIYRVILYIVFGSSGEK